MYCIDIYGSLKTCSYGNHGFLKICSICKTPNYCKKCENCNNTKCQYNKKCYNCKAVLKYCNVCNAVNHCYSCNSCNNISCPLNKKCLNCKQHLKICDTCKTLNYCTKCLNCYNTYCTINRCLKCNYTITKKCVICKTDNYCTKCKKCQYPHNVSNIINANDLYNIATLYEKVQGNYSEDYYKYLAMAYKGGCTRSGKKLGSIINDVDILLCCYNSIYENDNKEAIQKLAIIYEKNGKYIIANKYYKLLIEIDNANYDMSEQYNNNLLNIPTKINSKL